VQSAVRRQVESSELILFDPNDRAALVCEFKSLRVSQ
jgi:hypothetical protein